MVTKWRPSRIAKLIGSGGLGVGLAIGLAVAPVSASSTAGTQQITASTSTTGTLSVTAPSTLALSTLTPGSVSGPTVLGTVGWTDTLNDGTIAQSLTFASTDLAVSTSYIPYADFKIGVGSTITGLSTNTGTVDTAATGGPYVLSGTDTTHGVTYSSPVTLAGGDTTSEGSYTQAGNNITISVPANAVNYIGMAATAQYTITG